MIPFVLEIYSFVGKSIPIILGIVAIAIVLSIFNLIINKAQKRLLIKAKTKKQISNVQIFSRILKYVAFLFIVLIVIFSYSGSLTGLGLGLGLFSAALGWALQKPITGIAAWIMVVTRRPFEIGDRIILGNVKGDISDITLTHIYLKEIGGLVGGEENSGRIIMVPNSNLFEQNIINYTSQHDDTLDQVFFTIKFSSDLNKAIKLGVDSAENILKNFKEHGDKPYARTYFQPSGINIHIRYHAPAKQVQEISSNITQEIFKNINKEKDVTFAYPHTEVILNKN